MPRKQKTDDMRDFATLLAKMKVRAGELGLFETMQALETPLKKAGFEIAGKKQAAQTLRADIEFYPGTKEFSAFRVRRASDNFVVFWGDGPLRTPNPIKEWDAILRFVKKTPHQRFVISEDVKRFVKRSRKLRWSKDSKTIERKK